MSPHTTGTFSLLTTEFIISEVLTLLTVNSLFRLRCVSKFWNTLISTLITDLTFVKLHLQRSPKKKHIALTAYIKAGCGFVTFPLNHLIENPSITTNPRIQLEINDCVLIVGSCNGLLCLLGLSLPWEPASIWFRIWNPATKIISERLGSIYGNLTPLRYAFGYDDLTATYKAVVLTSKEVKFFNFGNNSWRTISSFPPFDQVVSLEPPRIENHGVYLSGTVNWFVIQTNWIGEYYQLRGIISADQFCIISLDLGTETYIQLSPPRGVDEVPYLEPTIVVLMDFLCFCHDLKKTHFVIWQMKEFGVEESWTQFLKISLQNLQIDMSINWRSCQLVPLCLSDNGDTLVLTPSSQINQKILYNLRDNRVEKTSDDALHWYLAKNYVESLSSIC